VALADSDDVSLPDSAAESDAEFEIVASDGELVASEAGGSAGDDCDDDENAGPPVRPAVGESVGLAGALVGHDDDALLETGGDEGCADDDGRVEVGAAVVEADEFDEGDFDGRCVGWLPSGGPGSTGGTRVVSFGGLGAVGPTGTIRPTPAAYVRSSPSTSARYALEWL
jgi:hypothetical protein